MEDQQHVEIVIRKPHRQKEVRDDIGNKDSIGPH